MYFYSYNVVLCVYFMIKKRSGCSGRLNYRQIQTNIPPQQVNSKSHQCSEAYVPMLVVVQSVAHATY